MIEQSFRVIDIASKLQTKNMGWMKDAGSSWPWHITFWDHQSECRPNLINMMDRIRSIMWEIFKHATYSRPTSQENADATWSKASGCG